jgi:cellulose synthase/poly-beta-1,6-N-acetylglucosamine synthase-like glycosyltransferase
MCGTGGNMAFRRSIFNTIGMFDENPRVAEDLEIFFRVLRGGFELVYEPVAVVRHRHVTDYRSLRRKLYRWGLGYISYLIKVIHTDPAYRKKARSEIIAWFYPYQLRDRLWQKLRNRGDINLPLGLIVAEITGGLTALTDYFLARRSARRQASVQR